MPDQEPQLAKRIKEILVERLFLDVDPTSVESAQSLTESYGVDSVRLFDMVVGLEEDFSLSFEDEELTIENFDTVATIAARVREKLDAQ